jgi:hypothetical protein
VSDVTLSERAGEWSFSPSFMHSKRLVQRVLVHMESVVCGSGAIPGIQSVQPSPLVVIQLSLEHQERVCDVQVMQ